MRKPSAKIAKIAVVALAIPLFGGFATYAAAEVSTKPAPQVVIPGAPGVDDKVGATHKTGSDDPANHDTTDNTSTARTTDDKGGVTVSPVSDDPAGHDATDDKGGLTTSTVSDDPAGHNATDDNGGVTKTTVSDDPASHAVTDDKGHDAVTPATPATTPAGTPVTIDDKGAKHGSGGHGADG